MKTRYLGAMLAAVLSLPAALAQELPGQTGGDSIKGAELKGKAPVSRDVLHVQLPKPQEATLGNGLAVALLEDHRLPTFSLQLVILSGGLSDPADKHGLAMATAALLREGTKTRSSREIAEQVASLGSSLGAGASPASSESVVNVTGLIENIDPILDLAADVVRNPSFPSTELDKFRARFLAQLQVQRTQPGFAAQEQFMRAIYGDHPAAYIVPPEAVLKSLASADLAAYHATHYRPNNAILVAYGDIKLPQLVAKLERAFGGWQKADVPAAVLPPVAAVSKSRVLLVERPASVQTSLWLGGLGIERDNPDYFAMLVMNHILGGGPASRLFMNLREDKGYTYGVYSSFTGSKFPGVVVASTSVRTSVTEGAMQELTMEIKRIATQPVTAVELTNAKRALVGRFALSLDAPGALIGNVVTQKIYKLPADYWDTYPRRVEAITAEDVQRVAKRYFDNDRLQIVAVGEASGVRKVLEKYGTVETPGSSAVAQ